jgi:hypothetical protein
MPLLAFGVSKSLSHVSFQVYVQSRELQQCTSAFLSRRGPLVVAHEDLVIADVSMSKCRTAEQSSNETGREPTWLIHSE